MKTRDWVILAVAGGTAWWFYRKQTGQPFIPAVLAGQGTSNSGLLNPSLGGQTSVGVGAGGGAGVGGGANAQPIDEATRLRLRNAATGPLSRGQCLQPRRWIDSVTGPYYGVCVDQATFTTWVSAFRGDVISNQVIASFLGHPIATGIGGGGFN